MQMKKQVWQKTYNDNFGRCVTRKKLIMAGHSHWAGIKHKKGRQDKERSKLFQNFLEKLQ